MNIFQIIESDHVRVRNLLQDLRQSSVKAVRKREQKFQALKSEMLVHMLAEEKVFYPLLLSREEDRESALEAEEAHQASRNFMADLESIPVTHERWKAKLQILGELIEHHIEEEEDVIFDEAREILDPQKARNLGVQFQTLKKETIQ